MRLIPWFFFGGLVDLVLLVLAGRRFGGGAALAWALGTALLGFYLLSGSGARLARAVQAAQGNPVGAMAGMARLAASAVGAVLLILPGPIGDLFGLLLQLPGAGLIVARFLPSILSGGLRGMGNGPAANGMPDFGGAWPFPGAQGPFAGKPAAGPTSPFPHAAPFGRPQRTRGDDGAAASVITVEGVEVQSPPSTNDAPPRQLH